MYLLDTDHISLLQHSSGSEFARLSTRMGRYSTNDFFFSVVSFHEQALGWNAFISNARDIAKILRGYRGLEDLIRQYSKPQILPYDQPAATIFESLRNQRVRIGAFDLRIAAIALSRGLIVLSRNLTDFRQVPQLHVEDWVQ